MITYDKYKYSLYAVYIAIIILIIYISILTSKDKQYGFLFIGLFIIGGSVVAGLKSWLINNEHLKSYSDMD
jgi:hypothetical protein